MRKTSIALIAALAAGALAWQAAPKLFVNGKEAVAGPIQSGGKWYVPVDELKKVGAEVTQTAGRLSVQFKPMQDRMQVDAVEGVKGEWVQNERFRVRVLSVKPGDNPFGRGPGYVATIEIRNLSKGAVNWGTSGSPEIQFIDSNGNVLKYGSRSFKDLYTSLAPGNGFTNDITFGDPANTLTEVGTPDKLIILFKLSGGKKLQDFRIDLKD